MKNSRAQPGLVKFCCQPVTATKSLAGDLTRARFLVSLTYIFSCKWLSKRKCVHLGYNNIYQPGNDVKN